TAGSPDRIDRFEIPGRTRDDVLGVCRTRIALLRLLSLGSKPLGSKPVKEAEAGRCRLRDGTVCFHENLRTTRIVRHKALHGRLWSDIEVWTDDGFAIA
ncbi:hypothetical protein, partial [Micropruina sp.]|uniref:hypothetical protein n=1 Tax=Micropruina sp. TaxID=2737536 RepID=UPI002612AABE